MAPRRRRTTSTTISSINKGKVSKQDKKMIKEEPLEFALPVNFFRAIMEKMDPQDAVRLACSSRGMRDASIRLHSLKTKANVLILKLGRGSWRFNVRESYSDACLTLGSDGSLTLDGSYYFDLKQFLESNETVTFEQLWQFICDSYVMGLLEIDGVFETSEVELIARICRRANAGAKDLVLYCKEFDESMLYLTRNIEAQDVYVTNITSLPKLNSPPVPHFSCTIVGPQNADEIFSLFVEVFENWSQQKRFCLFFMTPAQTAMRRIFDYCHPDADDCTRNKKGDRLKVKTTQEIGKWATSSQFEISVDL